jgi:hypothetical protein
LSRDFWSIGEHHPQDKRRVDQVVSLPLVGIGEDNLLGPTAYGVLPRHPVARVEADYYVGRIIKALAGVDILAQVGLAPCPNPGLCISRFDLPGPHDFAERFLYAATDKEAVKTNGKGS